MRRLIGSMLLMFSLPLAFFSCQPQQTNVAAVKTTIEETSAKFMKAFNEKDMAVTSFYAPDAMVLPQHGQAAVGTEQIEAIFKEFMATYRDLHLTSKKVDASGDLAYSYGEYTIVAMMPGMPEMQDTGKYVEVWKHQADGSWKIIIDIFNTNLPPPMMAMEEKKMEDKKMGKKK